MQLLQILKQFYLINDDELQQMSIAFIIRFSYINAI